MKYTIPFWVFFPLFQETSTWWFPKMGLPQTWCLIMENPIKNGWSWGYPHGLEPPFFVCRIHGWSLSGFVDAHISHQVAFKSWHLYASHVTGSTSAMAFRLEGYHQGEWGSATWPLKGRFKGRDNMEGSGDLFFRQKEGVNIAAECEFHYLTHGNQLQKIQTLWSSWS